MLGIVTITVIHVLTANSKPMSWLSVFKSPKAEGRNSIELIFARNDAPKVENPLDTNTISESYFEEYNKKEEMERAENRNNTADHYHTGLNQTTNTLQTLQYNESQVPSATNNINHTVTNGSLEYMKQEQIKNGSLNIEFENQEDPNNENSEEEGGEDGGGGIGNLITSILGGFSKPDGGVDLEAIAGLLGSLSTQNDDGTYDFSGLTELLRNFFAGDQEGGGGSDVGAFVGGLIGAVLQGLAKPPGARGTGIFTGKVLGGILPALSAPEPPPDETNNAKPKPLDPLGFITGFIKSFFGSSSGYVKPGSKV